jgi:hypothetical protein|tara:strand:- start:31 stop:405 length:375 start_codon:yes stop_codon:yes gene_type:complete
MPKKEFNEVYYPKGLRSLVGLMFILLVLVYVGDLTNEGITGYFTSNTPEPLFENEIWDVPCNHLGSEDFVKEILRDNYACEDYCFKAVLGVELPYNNFARIDCESYDNRTEWISDCKNHMEEFC